MAASAIALAAGQVALIYGAYLLIPAATAVGAIAGAIWRYEASLPSPPVNVTPTVSLVPGGGVAGIAGTF